MEALRYEKIETSRNFSSLINNFVLENPYLRINIMPKDDATSVFRDIGEEEVFLRVGDDSLRVGAHAHVESDLVDGPGANGADESSSEGSEKQQAGSARDDGDAGRADEALEARDAIVRDANRLRLARLVQLLVGLRNSGSMLAPAEYRRRFQSTISYCSREQEHVRRTFHWPRSLVQAGLAQAPLPWWLAPCSRMRST